jgi:hypothetical protein
MDNFAFTFRLSLAVTFGLMTQTPLKHAAIPLFPEMASNQQSVFTQQNTDCTSDSAFTASDT